MTRQLQRTRLTSNQERSVTCLGRKVTGLGTWLLLSCVKFCIVSRLWVVKPSTDHLTFDQLNLVKQLKVPPLALILDEKSGFDGLSGTCEK